MLLTVRHTLNDYTLCGIMRHVHQVKCKWCCSCSVAQVTIDSQIDIIILTGNYLEVDHVLGHPLKQRQNATLCIEPGVSLQLSAFRLHGLDDSGYAKLVVAFHTVQGPNDQVHNAEVKAALAWILHTTASAVLS